jgi:opacity protein-like surface antigen
MPCRNRVATAFALLGFAMVAQGARAADMPSLPPPTIPIQPVAPVTWLSTGGWYLRGDIGYRIATIDQAVSAPPFPSPRDSEFSNGLTATFGAGIKTSWLRTDLTLDYISATEYTGKYAVPGDTTAKVQAMTALFNGYFDLGTWYRLTPYVGAGGGVGYVTIRDFQSTNAPPFVNGDNDQWKFVWAGMAGVGWAVGPNLTLDLGYRYLSLGNLHSGSDAAGSMTLRNVAGHEVRVGLRWSYDDLREYR